MRHGALAEPTHAAAARRIGAGCLSVGLMSCRAASAVLPPLVLVLIGMAALVAVAPPAAAESQPPVTHRITGAIVAKTKGEVTVSVESVEVLSPRVTAPALGERITVGVHGGTRFLDVGRIYTFSVYDFGFAEPDRESLGPYETHLRTVLDADGSPVDTGLLRRVEVRAAIVIAGLALAGLALAGIVVNGVLRSRRPRSGPWPR